MIKRKHLRKEPKIAAMAMLRTQRLTKMKPKNKMNNFHRFSYPRFQKQKVKRRKARRERSKLKRQSKMITMK